MKHSGVGGGGGDWNYIFIYGINQLTNLIEKLLGSGGKCGEIRVQGGVIESGDILNGGGADEHFISGEECQHMERRQLHAASDQRRSHGFLLGSLLRHHCLFSALCYG